MLAAVAEVLDVASLSGDSNAKSAASSLATPLLGKITQFESFIVDVGNQAGWYVLRTGDEQFLIRSTSELQSLEDQVQFWSGANSDNMKQAITMRFQPDAQLVTTQPTDNTFPKPSFKYRFDRDRKSVV